jgi:tellurite resistance protein TerC
MLDGAPITYWIGFHVVILFLIVADLTVLSLGKASARTRDSLIFVLFVFALAACFGAWIGHVEEHQTALEFASGYLIELSLSIDNLFVFLLLFRAFGLGAEAQRKALLLGVLGAIVMRGLFIFAGIALLQRFAWIQYFFGALLLVAAARLLRGKKAGSTPAPAKWIAQWTKRWGSSPKSTFVLAVIAIEMVDLVFAVDSVPAVLAISAILGLRSLYFLLAGLLDRLRFLHVGLATILGFVGAKMMLAKWVHVPVGISLGFIVVVVAGAAAASLLSSTPHSASAP